MKNRSTVTNLLEYAFFVLNSIEEGCQVDSVHTDFCSSTPSTGGDACGYRTWFVNRISVIFDYVRVLFYADDMKLFLPVRDFQDCMKMQSDLNKLSEWCERNSLFPNVDKCKTITFSKTRYPVEFTYMLDRVSSINVLGVIMDEKNFFWSMWTSWLVKFLRCWDLSEDCNSSSEIHTL
jgi:hypothetical protein